MDERPPPGDFVGPTQPSGILQRAFYLAAAGGFGANGAGVMLKRATLKKIAMPRKPDRRELPPTRRGLY